MKKSLLEKEIKNLPDYLENVVVVNKPSIVKYPIRVARILRDNEELEAMIIEEVKNGKFSSGSKGGAQLWLYLCKDIKNEEYKKKWGSRVRKGRRISTYVGTSFKKSVNLYVKNYLKY